MLKNRVDRDSNSKEEKPMKKTVLFVVIAGILILDSRFRGNDSNPSPTNVIVEPSKEPEPTKPVETAKPVETTKPTEVVTKPEPTPETSGVTDEEAKELVIFGDQIDLYDKLQLATTTSGSKEIVANVPEGTKIYAPFDGNIIVSTSEIASYNVRPMRVYRVNSEKDEEIVSLSFLVQTWSDTIGNKTVKKGDYIGTIGKSAPILDSLSDIKGNNLCFSAVAAGFVKTQYNTPKDYIKGFIQFAEQFEVKELDLSSILQKQAQGK